MAKKTAGGTPATVALTRPAIAFTLHAYDHDPRAASYGLEAAEALGVDPARVFKTLHGRVDGAARGGSCRSRAARPQGAGPGGRREQGGDGRPGRRRAGHRVRRRRHLPGRPEAARTRPCSTRRRSTTPTVFVSAGRRGLDLEIAPADLVRITGAITARIGR